LYIMTILTNVININSKLPIPVKWQSSLWSQTKLLSTVKIIFTENLTERMQLRRQEKKQLPETFLGCLSSVTTYKFTIGNAGYRADHWTLLINSPHSPLLVKCIKTNVLRWEEAVLSLVVITKMQIIKIQTHS